MRYQENCSVDQVLIWLKEQNCGVSRRSYHDFMGRVLRLMSLEQAKELGLNASLLRAIRVRYKLPVNPRGNRVVIGKQAPRHNCRQRRRHILAEPRPKRQPASPPAHFPAQQARFEPNEPLRAGIAATPVPADDLVRKMRGTPDAPQGYGDWKIVNQIARKKVFKQDRQMILNLQGTVIHLKTREEYTPERLKEVFGLTEAEAQSCFMTFSS